MHMLFHWKVSNEIDIPHVATPNKDILEQVADTKQPFLFEKEIGPISIIALEGSDKDVHIIKPDKSTLMVPHKGMLNAIKKEQYLSMKNANFVKEVMLKETAVSLLNTYLMPPMTMMQRPDIYFGNHNVATTLTSSPNYRNYFICLDGAVDLKLMPPKCDIFLKESANHINVWLPSEEDKQILKECDIINLSLQKGSIIHIPAYWWYTIKFKEQACIMNMSYITYMNAISQIPSKISTYIKSKKIEF